MKKILLNRKFIDVNYLTALGRLDLIRVYLNKILELIKQRQEIKKT